MGGWIAEGLLFVLAGHIGQTCRQLRELSEGYHPPIDVSTGSTACFLAGHDASNHQFVVPCDPGFSESCSQCVAIPNIEDGSDLCLLGACAYQLGCPSSAQSQGQSVDQDRLARTGFSGYDVQPPTERDFYCVNDGKVANLQREQHGDSWCVRTCRPWTGQAAIARGARECTGRSSSSNATRLVATQGNSFTCAGGNVSGKVYTPAMVRPHTLTADGTVLPSWHRLRDAIAPCRCVPRFHRVRTPAMCRSQPSEATGQGFRGFEDTCQG